jgi:acyl-CoA thioesterase-1
MRKILVSRKSSVVSRKWAVVLIIACNLLLTTFLIGCAKREIKNLNSQGKDIICFGDSITFGYGVAPEDAFPLALAKMVPLSVTNSGIDGDTSTEALKRIESDVLSRDPRLVIVEFGGNDFLRKIPLDVTVDNIREMVEQIQARGAMVAITDISAGILMKEYRSPYWKIAQEKGAIFIPSIMSGIITNPKMKSDFLHPNANGYKIIAERIFKAIKPYLQK